MMVIFIRAESNSYTTTKNAQEKIIIGLCTLFLEGGGGVVNISTDKSKRWKVIETYVSMTFTLFECHSSSGKIIL